MSSFGGCAVKHGHRLSIILSIARHYHPLAFFQRSSLSSSPSLVTNQKAQPLSAGSLSVFVYCVAIVSPPPRSSVISSAARRCVSVSVIGWGTCGGIIHSGNAAVLYIAQTGAYYPNLIHGAKVIIFRDITKLFRHYF